MSKELTLTLNIDASLLRRRLKVLQGDLEIAAGALGRASSLLDTMGNENATGKPVLEK